MFLTTARGRRRCFRARLVDANRCEVQGPEAAWTMRRVRGEAEATLDRNCVVVSRGTDGEFELTATAGTFSARATAVLVTADRYRDLIAARLEDPDAGVEEPSAGGPRVGAIAVTNGPAPARRASPWLWALVGVAGLLGAAGVALLVRRRRNSLAPPPPPPRRDEDRSAKPEDEAIPGQRDVISVPAPSKPPRPSRVCPKCGVSWGDDLTFCPQDGTLLPGAQVPATPPVVAPPRAAPPKPAQPPPKAEPVELRVCPRCGRRYEAPTEFCGEDGATLTPLHS